MPTVSWTLALEMFTASGKPCLSTTRLILTPLIFLPPSIPRLPQVGAERHELSPDSRPLADGESGPRRPEPLPGVLPGCQRATVRSWPARHRHWDRVRRRPAGSTGWDP